MMFGMYKIVDPKLVRVKELGHKDNKHRFILIMPETRYALNMKIMWNEDDASKGVVSWDIIMRQEPVDPRIAELYPEHVGDVDRINKADAEVIKDANSMEALSNTNVLRFGGNAKTLSETLRAAERIFTQQLY